MTSRPGIDDRDLHGLLDGALDDERARAVAAQLAADPVLADRFAGFKSDKDMLKTLYGPIAAEPVPEEWLRLAASARPAKPRLSWRMVGAIAAVLLVAVTGALTYRNLQSTGTGEIVADALQAREDGAAPAIAVAGFGDSGRYAARLSELVAAHVKVPDLSRLGYRLQTLRFYPGGPGKGAAELSYLGSDGRVFTLYLRHSNGTARFDQFERAGLRVCIWQDDQVGMVMAGNVSTAAMQRLASLTYTGLTL